jgi:hypothetical protein
MPESRRPNVRTIRGVELIRAGTWQIKTGEWTVTPQHLAAAVEAHRAGILRKPVVRLGHDGPMRDAAPALGYVDNLRLADAGNTLIGDLVNVPKGVADLLPHAYPDRSVEAATDYEAEGRVWPLVLTGLALLGATAPGVTLRSLQDVAALYDVPLAASSGGRRITIAASTFRPELAAAARARAIAVARARRTRQHRLTGA